MAISEQVLHPGGVVDAAPVVVVPAPEPPETPKTIDEAIEARMDEARATPAPAPVVVLAPAVPDTTPDEQTTTGAVVDACTSAASTTWNWAKCAGRVLNGMRTLLFFGVTGGLALLAKVQDFDLSGIVSRVSGKQIAAEDVMLFMSTAGVVLRFVTSTPVFERWRKSAQGAKQDDASTGVDDGDTA